jgi:hypothetical protein
MIVWVMDNPGSCGMNFHPAELKITLQQAAGIALAIAIQQGE